MATPTYGSTAGGYLDEDVPAQHPDPTPPVHSPPPPPGAGDGPTDPPKPPSQRSSGAGRPSRRPVPGVRESRWRRFAAYPVLLAMAVADAFGFWNTLTQIIKQDTNLVLVFVIALAIGAVAVPHQAGRLARSRREGYGGSVSWILLLSALWLSLGLTIGWLRANSPSGGTGGRRTGELALASAQPAVDAASIRLAVLLLVLFLLTGALAMTHGYHFGDPRSAEARAAFKRRAQLAREWAERRYEVELAQGLLTLRREDRRREEKARGREHEIDEARLDLFQAQARHDTSRHVADPAGTDELIQTWRPRPADGQTQPLWPNEPPEI